MYARLYFKQPARTPVKRPVPGEKTQGVGEDSPSRLVKTLQPKTASANATTATQLTKLEAGFLQAVEFRLGQSGVSKR